MPIKKPLYSLSTKLLVSIVLWLVGAVLFTGLTLNLSWELGNGGVAINNAGSLRKRIYHIAVLTYYPGQQSVLDAEKIAFLEILTQLENYSARSWLGGHDPNSIHQQIQAVRTTGESLMEDLESSITDNGLNESLLSRADQLVAQLDALVKSIEIENTKNIQLLRIFQLILIGMVIFSAFVAILFLGKLVIGPLGRLQTAIQKIGQGDLSARVPVLSQDEFGEVSQGFNQMAENLSDLYQNLEIKVKEQTLALEEKNEALRLLYNTTAFLHEAQTQENMACVFLETVMHSCHASGGTIRIMEQGSRRLESICSIGLPEQFQSTSDATISTPATGGISAHQSNIIIQHLGRSTLAGNTSNLKFDHCISFYVRHNQHDIGILTLYFEQTAMLSEQEIHMIETLANQLGVAIENQRWALLEKQFAVLEERNFMAQGLHDSIAQSLSFLNMQVQMLENALQSGNQALAKENLNLIQKGMQETYEDVRELLLNFRVRINQENFTEALRSVIDRFQKQTGILTSLTITGEGPEPHLEQQLQIVFILQEALSNVRKHAHAHQTSIRIQKHPERFIMTIVDDGIGFDHAHAQTRKDSHVGMGIMRERAQRAGGSIKVQSEKNKGTRVTLEITGDKNTSQ